MLSQERDHNKRGWRTVVLPCFRLFLGTADGRGGGALEVYPGGRRVPSGAWTVCEKKAENTGMRNTQPSEKPAIAEKIHAKPIKQDIAIVQVLSFAIIGAEILPRSYFAAAFAWLAEEACVVI